MANLNTKYLDLLLKNPFINVSSCLTYSVANVIEFEQLGIGTIALKAHFEDEI